MNIVKFNGATENRHEHKLKLYNGRNKQTRFMDVPVLSTFSLDYGFWDEKDLIADDKGFIPMLSFEPRLYKFDPSVLAQFPGSQKIIDILQTCYPYIIDTINIDKLCVVKETFEKEFELFKKEQPFNEGLMRYITLGDQTFVDMQYNMTPNLHRNIENDPLLNKFDVDGDIQPNWVHHKKVQEKLLNIALIFMSGDMDMKLWKIQKMFTKVLADVGAVIKYGSYHHFPISESDSKEMTMKKLRMLPFHNLEPQLREQQQQQYKTTFSILKKALTALPWHRPEYVKDSDYFKSVYTSGTILQLQEAASSCKKRLVDALTGDIIPNMVFLDNTDFVVHFAMQLVTFSVLTFLKSSDMLRKTLRQDAETVDIICMILKKDILLCVEYMSNYGDEITLKSMKKMCDLMIKNLNVKAKVTKERLVSGPLGKRKISTVSDVKGLIISAEVTKKYGKLLETEAYFRYGDAGWKEFLFSTDYVTSLDYLVELWYETVFDKTANEPDKIVETFRNSVADFFTADNFSRLLIHVQKSVIAIIQKILPRRQNIVKPTKIVSDEDVKILVQKYIAWSLVILDQKFLLSGKEETAVVEKAKSFLSAKGIVIKNKSMFALRHILGGGNKMTRNGILFSPVTKNLIQITGLSKRAVEVARRITESLSCDSTVAGIEVDISRNAQHKSIVLSARVITHRSDRKTEKTYTKVRLRWLWRPQYADLWKLYGLSGGDDDDDSNDDKWYIIHTYKKYKTFKVKDDVVYNIEVPIVSGIDGLFKLHATVEVFELEEKIDIFHLQSAAIQLDIRKKCVRSGLKFTDRMRLQTISRPIQWTMQSPLDPNMFMVYEGTYSEYAEMPFLFIDKLVGVKILVFEEGCKQVRNYSTTCDKTIDEANTDESMTNAPRLFTWATGTSSEFYEKIELVDPAVKLKTRKEHVKSLLRIFDATKKFVVKKYTALRTIEIGIDTSKKTNVSNIFKPVIIIKPVLEEVEKDVLDDADYKRVLDFLEFINYDSKELEAYMTYTNVDDFILYKYFTATTVETFEKYLRLLLNTIFRKDISGDEYIPSNKLSALEELELYIELQIHNINFKKGGFYLFIPTKIEKKVPKPEVLTIINNEEVTLENFHTVANAYIISKNKDNMNLLLNAITQKILGSDFFSEVYLRELELYELTLTEETTESNVIWGFAY